MKPKKTSKSTPAGGAPNNAKAFVLALINDSFQEFKAGLLDELKTSGNVEGDRLKAIEGHIERLEKAHASVIRSDLFGPVSEEVKALKPLAKVLTESKTWKDLFGEESRGVGLSPNERINTRGVEVEGGFKPYFERRSLTSEAGSGGAWVPQPLRVGAIPILTRQPTIRDLIPSMTLQSGNSIELPVEDGWLAVEATTTAALTGADGDDVIAVDSASGFKAGALIIIGYGTANEEEAEIESVDYEANTITLTEEVANDHASGVTVTSEDFVFTPETKVKPRADARYSTATHVVKTIAAFIPVTRQLLADAPGLESYLGSRLEARLALAEESQILYGDGTARQLQGIMTHPSVQSHVQSSVAGDTAIDAIRRGVTRIQLAHLRATGAVINPLDWESIQLAKDDEKRYIWVSVDVGGREVIWSLPVIVTPAIQPKDVLIGAFAECAAIWDREEATIRMSDSHEDFFTRNMVAILAEERMTLAIYRPQGFCVITLT